MDFLKWEKRAFGRAIQGAETFLVLAPLVRPSLATTEDGSLSSFFATCLFYALPLAFLSQPRHPGTCTEPTLQSSSPQ